MRPRLLHISVSPIVAVLFRVFRFIELTRRVSLPSTDLDRIVYTTPSEYLAIDASGSNGNSANGIGAAAAGNNGGTGAAPLSAGTSGFCLAGTAALAVLLLYAIGL